MAYKLAGNPNVTVYNSWQEAKDAGKIDKVEEGADGNLYATPHQGWLLKNMPWLVLGGMAAGAGLAAAGYGAGASASAAAGGVLPSSHLPVAALMGGPAAITSMGVSSGVGAGVGAATGLAAGAAGGAAKGVAGSILGWLKDPKNLLGLAGAVPLAMHAFGGNSGGTGSSPNEDALLAEIRTNLGLQRDRFKAAQPAFEAAQRMAVGMAPTQYTSGGPY